MNGNVDADMILRFGLKCLGIFVIIFLLAVLTPWMAKHVDEWIAKYRESHPAKSRENYGIRSIYELPSEPEQKPAPPQEHAKKKAVVSVRKKSDKK